MAAITRAPKKYTLTPAEIAKINEHVSPLCCHNVVARVHFCCEPDVAWTAWELWGKKDDAGFTAPGTIQSKDPRTTILFFQSGKCIFVGSKTIEQCRLAVRLFANRLRVDLGMSSEIVGFDTCNKQYTVDCGYEIDVARLRAEHPHEVVYDADNFVAAIARISKDALGLAPATFDAEKDPLIAEALKGVDAKLPKSDRKKDKKCVSVLIFSTGSVVLCGSASHAGAQAAFNLIAPLLAHYCVRHISRSARRQEMKASAEERQAIESDLHAKRMIRLNNQVLDTFMPTEEAPVVLSDTKDTKSMDDVVDMLPRVHHVVIDEECQQGCVHSCWIMLQDVEQFPDQVPQVLRLNKAQCKQLMRKSGGQFEARAKAHFGDL